MNRVVIVAKWLLSFRLYLEQTNGKLDEYRCRIHWHRSSCKMRTYTIDYIPYKVVSNLLSYYISVEFNHIQITNFIIPKRLENMIFFFLLLFYQLFTKKTKKRNRNQLLFFFFFILHLIDIQLTLIFCCWKISSEWTFLY